MKKLLGIALCAALISLSGTNYAQEKKDSATVGKTIKKTTKTVVNKTSETAAKGAAKIVDRVYKDKVGPQGQTIYIDKHSKYYYVDKKGQKFYVPKNKLKNKPVGK